jgi:hypothetical protein
MISLRYLVAGALLTVACSPSSAPKSEPAPAPAPAPAPVGASDVDRGAPAAGGVRYRSTPGTLPMPAPSAAGPAGTITVTAATYGVSCEAAAGNVTAYVAASCNGKPACAYKVDYVAIGDPAVGCSKDFVVTWHCGEPAAPREQTAPAEAGYGAVVPLRCTP